MDKDRAALKYAGMMGHRYVIVGGHIDLERRVLCEVDDLSIARQHHAEYAVAGDNPAIYRRQGNGWKRTA